MVREDALASHHLMVMLPTALHQLFEERSHPQSSLILELMNEPQHEWMRHGRPHGRTGKRRDVWSNPCRSIGGGRLAIRMDDRSASKRAAAQVQRLFGSPHTENPPPELPLKCSIPDKLPDKSNTVPDWRFASVADRSIMDTDTWAESSGSATG